jgi:hypothetical protein
MKAWKYSASLLHLGTRWRLMLSFTHQPLYSERKTLRYPFDRRLGGPQFRSEGCGERKILALPGIEPGNSSP